MKPVSSISAPALTISFITATFGMLNFASGVFALDADSIVAIGLIKLLLGTLYFIAALVNIFKGIPLGNINLIFSVCFGLFSGTNLMITTIHGGLSLISLPKIYGMLQITAGLYLLCLLPALRHVPLYQWINFALTVLGLCSFGIEQISGWTWLSAAGGWIFLIFGLINIYSGLSTLLPLPQGKSLEELMNAKRSARSALR